MDESKRIRWKRRLGFMLGVMIAIVSLLGGCSNQQNPIESTSMIQLDDEIVGVNVARMSLPTMDGAQLVIGGDQEKIQILHLWTSWCTTCNQEAPGLMKELKKLPNDVEFIGVNAIQYDDRDEAWDFVSRYQLSFKQVWDEGDVLGNLVRVRTYPSTIVLDRKGSVVYQEFGPISMEKILKAISEIK